MSMIPEGTSITFTTSKEIAAAILSKTIESLGRYGLVTEFDFDNATPPPFEYDEQKRPYFGKEHLRYFAVKHGYRIVKADTAWNAIHMGYMNWLSINRRNEDADNSYWGKKWIDSGLEVMVRDEWTSNHTNDYYGLNDNMFVSIESLQMSLLTGTISNIENIAKSRMETLSEFLVDTGLI